MDRVTDLTYEISKLESDIATLEFELSRQSTPVSVVRRSALRQPRRDIPNTRTNVRTPSPSRRVSFPDAHLLSDAQSDRGRQTSDTRHGTDVQGNVNTASFNHPQQGLSPSPTRNNITSLGSVRFQKNIIKTATYDGKSSWIDFKSHFDICAQLNDWNEAEKGLFLAVSLRGGAQAVLGNLPVESRKNYKELCTALEDRFCPSNQMDLYRAQLKERRQKASESIPELGQDIRRLTNLAYAKAPSDVQETLAKEYFIDALHNADMRLKIKQSRPKNLNEAVCLAVELDAFNNAEKKRDGTGCVRAAECHKVTDVSSKDVIKLVQDTNKALSDMRKEIQDLRQSQNRDITVPTGLPPVYQGVPTPAYQGRPKVRCFYCNKEGHIQRRCRAYIKAKQEERKKREKQGPTENSLETKKGSSNSLGSANVTGQSGMFLSAEMNGKQVKLLIDTGATISIIAQNLVHNTSLEKMESDILIADGSALSIKGVTTLLCKIGGMDIHQKMAVANIGVDGILGLDFMKSHTCSIDIVNGNIVIDGNTVNLIMEGNIGCYRVFLDETLNLPPMSEVVTMCPVQTQAGKPVTDLGLGIIEPIESFTKSDRALTARIVTDCSTRVPVRLMNLHSDNQNIRKGTVVAQYVPITDVIDTSTGTVPENDNIPGHLTKLFEDTSKRLSPEQCDLFKQFLLKHQNLFAKDGIDLGRAESVKHKIDTGVTTPIKQAPRRLPEHMHTEVDKHIEAMLVRKVIHPSDSPWSSPIVLAKKKDGSTRFCVDYRKLNEVTVKDAYPLPLIQESLDHLSGAKWFSTLDLCMGYWQVAVDPNDQHKTAFATRRGLFEFSVMPFGLCNAPATFQRLMESVLRGLQFETCLVYLDDIIVVGKSFEQMIENLTMVFSRLAQAGLKLKAKKCTLFAKEVEYLGHVISESGTATSKDKIQVIIDWPVPKNVTEVRSFLGLCSYYRKFVPNFAYLAGPLHTLTKKGRLFKWTDICQKSFEQLKQALTSPPILRNPDFAEPFILDTDASESSIGAVLSQNIGGTERVCAYASRTLSKSERKYCVTRKELLAVVHFVRHFRHYLYGRKFLIRTDHSSLRWLMHFKNPENQLARWLEILSEFDFDIQHRPGRQHTNADALSRLPCKQCGYHTDWDSEHPRSEHVLSLSSSLLPIQEVQSNDKNLQKVRSWLDNKTRPDSKTIDGESYFLKSLYSQFERLCIIDNIMYRKWDNFESNESVYQALVPLSERRTILQYCHDERTAGHLGIKKTLDKIRKGYYWPKLQADVRQYVTGCEFCTKRKGKNKTKRAPMKLVQTGYPMERLALDILGELPVTDAGNKYVLVISDYFTKWTESFPMPNMEAATCAKILVEHVISRFGVPATIHSDQGSQFESALFQEMCKLLGIKKTRTTPYHPQSDGMVERFNRTLTSMLSAFVNENHNDWDEQLPFVMMAYRSSVHETTGYTPNALMLGREMCTPLDIMYEMPSQVKPQTQSKWCWLLQERLENAHTHVRVHTGQMMARQKHYHDRKLHWETYSPGDRVCVYFPRTQTGKSPKFTSYWFGPYTVKKKMTDVTYLVDCGRRGSDQVIHTDRIRRLRSQTLLGETDDISPSQSDSVNVDDTSVSKSDNDEPCDLDNESDEQVVNPPHRPFRNRRPPVYLKDYDTGY
ncbi:hypothetical protein FSP39_007335 [Pinctada imbricata]|uniref:RNA-directed DNA polymerase n=1 Tax=Pinctada imbricata TaxID=66713 RepID=A0AA89C7X7_PINIB|nr:hypothetical protein FSP39_007335 [Pinctada imbricata]